MEKIAQATDVQFRAKPGGHLVKFNLQDADLAELVNHISGLTGKRFIYGAKVRQVKATVVSPGPVTLEEAYQAFLSILEANGMTVVPHGRFLKIVDSGGVVGAATPLYARGEPVPDSDRYVTRLYRLENVSPDEVMPILTEVNSASCFNMSKLNLYQCLAVAGPHYEDIFCLGQHAMIDTGTCVLKAAGAPINGGSIQTQTSLQTSLH
jgi:type II secretory pathway component GspD/PulD (secretin)